jgi:predicted esterase
MMKRLWNGCSENIKGDGSMQSRKYRVVFAIFLMFTALFTGCSRNTTDEQISSSKAEPVTETVEKGQAETKEPAAEAIADTEISTDAPEDYMKTGYKADTKVWDVINDPAFQGYGRLIFPADRSIEKSVTLSEVGSILPYYTYVNTHRTVEIVNYMKTKAEAGEQIFYDIYTEEEKAADPAKKNTGFFFFRGNPGEKFAIVNAGGAFVYVGAMHDSFPHALELSKKGYNAFALIYRPGAETAPEDLARAIAFVFKHADELEVDTADYSLWGGSAGARMAAWLGSNGTAVYGEAEYPRPAAVILQYTGLSEVNGNEPPTYVCVGASDGIANYRIMENRINQIKANGTDAEIEIFDHLPHGFGLGEGTIAEGWIDHAVKFWENQMK